MEIKMNKNLNNIFEILGLLYISNHPEYMDKDEMLKSASELGINGEELYKKYGNILKRYVTKFQEKIVKNKEDDFFFDDTSNEFILILQLVCGNNPSWFDNIETISVDEIVLAVINAIVEEDNIEIMPTFQKSIELLKSSGLESDVCWKLMLFLQEPKKQIQHLADIIKKNIPAYLYAVSFIEKPLAKLLKELPNYQYKLVSTLKQETVTVTPILIYPAVEMIDPNGNIYIGLFTKEAYKLKDKLKYSRDNLLSTLKALGDKSKFNILVSLKHSPKYNLELAEQLGLSAPTISHHMNVLLAYDLVSIEKNDAHFYYTLSKASIEKLITELQYIFSL